MVELDGWMALPAFVPPKERRGLVLIDPPYEQKDEFERAGRGLYAGVREMADRHLPAVVSAEECRRASRRSWRGTSPGWPAPVRRPENPCVWNFSVAPQTAETGLTQQAF